MMPNTGNKGGSHQQSGKAAQPSQKNAGNSSGADRNDENDGANRGGSHEHHGKASQQAHKNK